MIINHAILKKISNVEGQTCFGCGEINTIGLHMEFLTDGQRVYSFVTVPSAMAGWDQTVHGGVTATILDEIMGWSVIYLLKKIGVTKSITCWGKTYRCRFHPGNTIRAADILVTGEIYSEEDTLFFRINLTGHQYL